MISYQKKRIFRQERYVGDVRGLIITMTRDRRNKKLNIATGKAKLVNNND